MTRPTPDSLRADASRTVWHMSRPDGCDCPDAPCGLTVTDLGCRPHREAFKTVPLTIHDADRCPGETT